MEEEISGSTEKTSAGKRRGKSFWYCTFKCIMLKSHPNIYDTCLSQLKSENSRLLKALSVEKNSTSSVQNLQQQVISLSSHLSQKDRLIKSQEEKVGHLLHNHKQRMKVCYNAMLLSENVTLITKCR